MKTVTTTLSLLIALFISFSSSAQTTGSKTNQVAVEITHEDGQVVLNWNTVKEINSSYFLVEKSTDGIHFTQVKMITAAGNSNFARNYTFTDPDTNNGNVFYRVMLVTMNGQQIVSASVPALNTSLTNNLAVK
ncbi:MAG: hypothetical protein K1X81_01120 [Bacteroidia bacterium]|nr:hypothetical protein [Bacteroidia bacterium]